MRPIRPKLRHVRKSAEMAQVVNYRHISPTSRPGSSSRATTTPATSSSMTAASHLACILHAPASQCSTERAIFCWPNPSRNPDAKSDKRMYRSPPPIMGVGMYELPTVRHISRSNQISVATSARSGSTLGGAEGTFRLYPQTRSLP